MSNLPSMEEMLKAGVHFGHHLSKRNPKMSPYIYTNRNKIHIIDLEETVSKLQLAMDYVSNLVATGGVVLFVGSKNQAKPIVEKYAKECGMPYINYRWLGGTFTNLGSILKLIKKLKELEQQSAKGELEKYTKKEQLNFHKTIERLNQLVGGIKELNRLPDAVFIIDIKKEKTALSESIKKGVPVIAMTDTNVDPSKVDYPIPANDDATKAIEMITSLIAEAAKRGKDQVTAPAAAEKNLNNIKK